MPGLVRSDDEWFWRYGERCGCVEGRSYCRAAEPPKCFLKGSWYSIGWRIGTEYWTGEKGWCWCDASLEWQCASDHGAKLVPLQLGFFAQTSILVQAAIQDLTLRNMLAGLTEHPDRPAALVAFADLEDPDDRALARRQGETVRQVLANRGIDPGRLFVMIAERPKSKGVREYDAVQLHLIWNVFLEPPERGVPK